METIFFSLLGEVTREREIVTSDEAWTDVSVSEGGYRQYGDTLQLLARSNKRTQRVTILELLGLVAIWSYSKAARLP